MTTRSAPTDTRSLILPAGLLALGLATAGGGANANAGYAYASTSVDADQAAFVFDAAFANHVKLGRSAAASGRTATDKPWANTVDRNFYGQ